MKQVYLLDYKENLKKVEEEEKYRFVKSVLAAIGINIDFWKEDLLSVQDRIKLKGILSSYKISIIDSFDGHLQVFANDDLIGEWRKCTFKIKQDLSIKDPKKRKFIEMETDFWTTFDEQLDD